MFIDFVVHGKKYEINVKDQIKNAQGITTFDIDIVLFNIVPPIWRQPRLYDVPDYDG